MTESILIQSVKIISSNEEIISDIFIKDGKIQKIAESISIPAEIVINGKNLVLLPGVIDPHVHSREPGFTWKEDLSTLSKAALAGGVTSIFDMPNTNPETTTLTTLQEKKSLAASKCLVNYNFFIGASIDNLKECQKAENIPGIKIFMGSSTGGMLLDDPLILEDFFSKTETLIAVHAEDEAIIQMNKQTISNPDDPLSHLKIRNVEAALTALKKAVSLSLKYRHSLHLLHITSDEEIQYLKNSSLPPFISFEICPQHFLLHAPFIYEKLGTLAKVNPPIREKKDNSALINALNTSSSVCLATDHAPHTLKEKEKPFSKAPSGMPGIETALPLMLNRVNQNKCSLKQLVFWMAENPARIFKIKNKGFIKENFDADLTLVDMNSLKTIRNTTLHTKSKWSAFQNQTLKGWPVITIVNGNIMYQEGDFLPGPFGKEILIF